jgi:hypothetical protein
MDIGKLEASPVRQTSVGGGASELPNQCSPIALFGTQDVRAKLTPQTFYAAGQLLVVPNSLPDEGYLLV